MDDFFQEEMKLETIVGIEKEPWNLALINRVKKGSEKGRPQKGQRGKKEDLSSSN